MTDRVSTINRPPMMRETTSVLVMMEVQANAAPRASEPVSPIKMQNAGIVRNRRKIVSVIENARHFLEVQREFGSFDRFLWAYVDGKPIVNSPETDADVPASTPLSDRISRDLKKRGFTFVGTTIVYSLLQSAGLVDDHLKGCSWHASCRPPE